MMPEETDPILGEPLFVSTRNGGWYKLAKDEIGEGDIRIISQENQHLRNIENLFFLASLLLLITFATGISAYLTFTMSSKMAAIALISMVIAIMLDFFVYRNILVFIISILIHCLSKCKCSRRKFNMGGKLLKEIWKMMREVIKNESKSDSKVINIK